MDTHELLGALRARVPAALVSLAAGAAAVAGSYAAAGFTPSYVVAPVEAFIAQYIPGVFIRFAIVVLGDLGQKLALLGATALSAALLGVAAGAGWWLAERSAVPAVGVPLAGALVWAPTAGVTGAPVLSLGAALAAVPVVGVAIVAGHLPVSDGTPTPGRRRVVGSLASLAGVGALGWVLGGRRGPGGSGGEAEPTPLPFQQTEEPAASGGGTGSDASGGGEDAAAGEESPTPSRSQRMLAEADRKSMDVDGLEPLVSSSFYTVDISSVNPQVDATDWSLTVTGAVDEETSFGYRDLYERESVQEFVTLRCVGETLNGKKTDNAVWEGVPAKPLLEEAGVPDECCVMLRGADGFYEEFPLDALEDATFAYRMNGEILPRAHGYPVRALVPGHWGEINVKWVDEIEILEEEAQGYWEKKGWHGTGPVNTVAKLSAQNELGDGRREVAGHAYAGTRGIDRVEVSADGGETWSDAELSEPLPGDDVWRQWRYEYDDPGEEHQVVVRATDGTGTRQPEDESGAFPSGPTGWVDKRIKP